MAAMTALALPAVAVADDVSIKLEPGVAIPLSAPQDHIYDVGASQSFKVLFGLRPWLDVGPSTSVLYLPASAEGSQAGTSWSVGAGLRLKRPHDAIDSHGISPWFDFDALYVRTGDLNRSGFDAAVGLSVPIGDRRTFWVGPFVRYAQTLQFDREGYDNRDAKILSIGLSLEAGSGIARKLERVAVGPEDTTPVTPIAPVATACPDRDNDGIADAIDHCPDVAGLMDNWGCPNYDKVVVKKDKLELKEKLYFAWDKAQLEDASFPILDDVVQALKDNQGFRVQVEGHTDSSGGDDHNQTLSEQRADAVLDYLVSHGISKDRLISKGFASSEPIDTNETVAGRENNRRVEFVVNFIIVNTGSGK